MADVTTQIGVRVPVELVEQLERIAQDDDRTFSYVVRKALAEFAERSEEA